MRTLRCLALFLLVLGLFALRPVAAQLSTGQTASPAPLTAWRGQLYMRATWLQGKTPALAASSRVDLYVPPTSSSLGTYVLQGSSGSTLWNHSAIVFFGEFIDQKVGTAITGHVSHILAYGPYRTGTKSTDMVAEAWVTVPDVGTPTIAYKLNLLDKKRPPSYQGAVFKPLTTLTLGTGFSWIFLPLAL